MHEPGHSDGLIGKEIHFENIFQFLADIFKHASVITIFVMIMMLLIEYLTVQTKGRWSKPFEKNPFLQVLFAAIMGVIPGCFGVYIIVTLYVHRVFNFAALVVAMIATSGDEAFVLLGIVPSKALLLFAIMFGISVLVGLFLNLTPVGKSLLYLPVNHMKLHEHDPDCTCFEPSLIITQLRKISFERAILLSAWIIFTVLLLSGDLGPEKWTFSKFIFLIVAVTGIFIITTVPDHFLTKHLWDHVIKKHFMKILLWTFGTFLVIHIGLEFLQLEPWLKNNIFIVLSIAVVVGIIPESGPHLIFITLFANGSVPFSILLANSIVQDGHGALPLLAESRKGFIYMKGINLIVGFLIGIAGILLGF